MPIIKANSYKKNPQSHSAEHQDIPHRITRPSKLQATIIKLNHCTMSPPNELKQPCICYTQCIVTGYHPHNHLSKRPAPPGSANHSPIHTQSKRQQRQVEHLWPNSEESAMHTVQHFRLGVSIETVPSDNHASQPSHRSRFAYRLMRLPSLYNRRTLRHTAKRQDVPAPQLACPAEHSMPLNKRQSWHVLARELAQPHEITHRLHPASNNIPVPNKITGQLLRAIRKPSSAFVARTAHSAF